MNMLKFAALVSWLTTTRFANQDASFSEIEAEILQHHIKGLMPEVGAVSCADVDALLSAMHQINSGKRIEAIKAYRVLTKAGLKESKDAVERYALYDPREGKPEYRCDLLEIQRNSNDDVRLRIRFHENNMNYNTGEIVITSAVHTINFDKGYAVTKNSVYRWF